MTLSLSLFFQFSFFSPKQADSVRRETIKRTTSLATGSSIQTLQFSDSCEGCLVLKNCIFLIQCVCYLGVGSVLPYFP